MKNLLFTSAPQSSAKHILSLGSLQKTVLVFSILFLTALKFSLAQDAVILKTMEAGPNKPDSITGINNYDLKAGALDIYPNPFSEYTTVKIPSKVMLGYFNIYDITGKMIMNIEISNAETILIERQNLAGGSYIYNLKSNDKIVAQGKLVVSN